MPVFKKDSVDIVLVEDSPTDAELTIAALREHNLLNDLIWLKDGAEALDYLFGRGDYVSQKGRTRPRLLLLDLRLPKVDGFEVIRTLKSDASTKCIPIVVLTSSKEDRDVVESFELGVNSFVSKPVEFEEFTRVVAQVGLYWLMLNRSPR